MLAPIFTAFILGLVGGIVPGPVLTATFTEILQAGFFKSMRIVFIALFTETVVAVASLLALSAFGFPEAFFHGLSIVGAGILIWISTQLWKIRSLDMGERVHFGFWKISTMILANGVLWTFWITVCVPKALALGEQIAFGEYLFLFAVEIGWVVSTIAVALVFSWFRGILSNPRVVPAMFKLFAVVFVYFALTMLYESAKFFLA